MRIDSKLLIKRAAAILLMLSTAFAANAKNLVIDGEKISPELVSAYGQALIHHQYHCIPLPYEAVRDRFIQLHIKASHYKKSQIELNQQKYLTAIAPYQKKVNRLERLVLKHAEGSRIKEVYQQQLERYKLAIETLREGLEDESSFFSHTSVDENSRLGKLTFVTDEEKKHLLRMTKLERESNRRVRDTISDKAIIERHKQLIKEKNSRLVNVYVFNERFTVMGYVDPQRVENVKTLMANNATGMEIGRAGGVITAWSMEDEPRWTAFSPKKMPNVDPSKLDVGEFIGPVKFVLDARDGFRYSLTYIADKKHYPVIGLDLKTVHRFSAKNFAHEEEYKSRISADYEKLRKQIEVTDNGVPVVEVKQDLSCRYK